MAKPDLKRAVPGDSTLTGPPRFLGATHRGLRGACIDVRLRPRGGCVSSPTVGAPPSRSSGSAHALKSASNDGIETVRGADCGAVVAG